MNTRTPKTPLPVGLENRFVGIPFLELEIVSEDLLFLAFAGAIFRSGEPSSDASTWIDFFSLFVAWNMTSEYGDCMAELGWQSNQLNLN